MHVTSYGRCIAKYREFEIAILRLFKMLPVGNPNKNGPRNGAGKLRSDIGAYLFPGKTTNISQRKGGGRVEMPLAPKMQGSVYTHEYCNTPAKCYNNPTSIITFRFVEQNIRYYTISQNNK
ncbi:unannotated protein [freshwater metagenome]|uniref:Unannotated protein n=1 Tax=freshwater metagenome TaxID=449393 RepID=A0A6J7ID57_9ZZZZ